MRPKLRTALLLAALAGTAAPPAIAAMASGAKYSGKITQGGTIRFTAATSGSKVTKIHKFKVGGISVTCKGGNSEPVSLSSPGVTVKKGKFHGTSTVADLKVTVSGKFAKGYKTASGTYSISGNLSPYTGCKSGKDHWKASKS